jgi:hypothetical protein
MPISIPAVSDLWSGEVAIGGLNWTHLRVVLSNELIALSLPKVGYIYRKGLIKY